MIDFEKIARENYRKLFSFALHLSGNKADAEDLTQHTFFRLASNLNSIRKEEKARSWLYSTLYRKFIDQRRRIVKFPSTTFDEEVVPNEEASPRSQQTLDHRAVDEAMAELEEEFRAPLSLFYLEDYSYKDISKMLNLPVGTVMSRLHRGKTKLHAKLTLRMTTDQISG
jgi:RNA polymerase sigma-70 factor (ECF subfamily)